MFGENCQGPLRAGGEETIVMRVDAHLKQTRDDEQTNAEPCNLFEPLLHSFDEYQLCVGVQCALHGWKNKQRDRREAANPCGGCQHV